MPYSWDISRPRRSSRSSQDIEPIENPIHGSVYRFGRPPCLLWYCWDRNIIDQWAELIEHRLKHLHLGLTSLSAPLGEPFSCHVLMRVDLREYDQWEFMDSISVHATTLGLRLDIQH